MLDLQDFTATLASGAFVIGVLATMAYGIIGAEFLRKLFPFVKRKLVPLGTAGVLLVTPILFGIGILAEDISNTIVDDEDKDEKRFFRKLGDPLLGLYLSLPLEKDLRRQALFPDSKFSGEFEASALAIELSNRGLFSRYSQDYAKADIQDVERAVREKTEIADKTMLEDLANGLYYTAKNTVYGIYKGVYGKELQLIQFRIDFARSIAFSLTILLNLFVFVVLPICVAIALAKKDKYKESGLAAPKPGFCIRSLILSVSKQSQKYWRSRMRMQPRWTKPR